MTLKDLAEKALFAQDACNLSGVVLSWGEIIHELRKLCPELDTDGINHHPVNVMFANKVESLTGLSSNDVAFGDSYNWCLKTSEKV